MPPNLEEFIPKERLPDFIDAYVDENFLSQASGFGKFSERWALQSKHPIRFVRHYPRRTIDYKGMFNIPS